MSKILEKEKIKEVIIRLLKEIEEEDIGISLFTMHYQMEEELAFFSSESRQQVVQILTRVSEDSLRHKTMIKRAIALLEAKSREY